MRHQQKTPDVAPGSDREPLISTGLFSLAEIAKENAMRSLMDRMRVGAMWAVILGLPVILDACARNTHIHV